MAEVVVVVVEYLALLAIHGMCTALKRR